MRIFPAAMVIAFLAGPAFAQTKPIPRYGDLEGKSDREIRDEKEAEKAYQKTLGNIPEKKGSSDPWGTVRSESAPKTAAPKAVVKDAPAKDAPAKRAKADGAAK